MEHDRARYLAIVVQRGREFQVKRWIMIAAPFLWVSTDVWHPSMAYSEIKSSSFTLTIVPAQFKNRCIPVSGLYGKKWNGNKEAIVEMDQICVDKVSK